MGNSPTEPGALPLCVDLDGTLVRTDLSVETLLAWAKQNPGFLFLLPWWLLKGRAYLKHQVALQKFPVSSLPYNDEFLTYLSAERQKGRRLYLVTASDHQIAEKVAAHLAIFEDVLASDGKRNLSGMEKARVLREKFGDKKFAYAGNARVDRHVWRFAAEAILVDPSPCLLKQARKLTTVERVFGERCNRWTAAWRAMRPHHWTKNLLVFVPLITAHKFADAQALAGALSAFVSFCLATSGTYLLNDLLDLSADRKHPEKRRRPFASGELSLLWGLAIIPVLMTGSLLVSLYAPHAFLPAMGAYLALTTAYSLYVKEILMMDVIALGILYTLRILAGAMAIQVPVSPWLLAFSMFWFLSLAFMKRFLELSNASNGNLTASARGYMAKDLPLLANLGISCGLVAVLVFALYADSGTVSELYLHPRRLWSICLLLVYWISRAWLLAQRGRVQEDPIRFAVSDRQSYAIGLLAAILFWVSGAR